MFSFKSLGTERSQSTDPEDWFAEEYSFETMPSPSRKHQEKSTKSGTRDKSDSSRSKSNPGEPSRGDFHTYKCSFCNQLGHNRYEDSLTLIAPLICANRHWLYSFGLLTICVVVPACRENSGMKIFPRRQPKRRQDKAVLLGLFQLLRQLARKRQVQKSN